MEAKFHTQRKRSAYIPIIIGFIILVSPFIAIYLDPDDQFDFSFSWFAPIPIAIFVFFTYVLLSSSLKMFITYRISTDGIRVITPPFRSHLFGTAQIEKVKRFSKFYLHEEFNVTQVNLKKVTS